MQYKNRIVTIAMGLLAMGPFGIGCGDDSTTGGGGEGGGDPTTTTGGSGGTGGDGGTGGSGGGGSEIEARVADCLRIDACEADGGTPIGLEACLAYALDEQWLWASFGSMRMSLEAMQCKLAATDCETVRACTPDASQFATQCAKAPFTGICVGDVWVLCDELGAPTGASDCSAAGLSCGTDVWAGCGAEPCQFGATEPSCDTDDPHVLVECSPAGFLTRVDCRTANNFVNVNGPEGEEVFTIAGETCGMDVQRGTLGCIGTGDSCDFFSQACDGDVLETCSGGSITRRDCSALQPEGQSCGFVQSGPFAGGAACGQVEPTCTLVESDETCDDGVIHYCGFAGATTVDCRDAGYAGCNTTESNGRTIAFCTP